MSVTLTHTQGPASQFLRRRLTARTPSRRTNVVTCLLTVSFERLSNGH